MHVEGGVKIHEIPKVLVVDWNDSVKSMIDTWSSYIITVAQFREAIMEKGVSYAKAHGGRAWIMDASKAKGAFPQDVQKLIETEVFKTFAAIGVKHFLTIKSETSALTNMAIGVYTANLGPHGIQMVDVPDQKTAISWLMAHR